MSALLCDATRPWSVRITAEDIDGAERCHPAKCISARAIRRQRGVLDARVGGQYVYVTRRAGVTRYELSANDRKLIAGFDDVREAFAAGYVLCLKVPRVTLGARRGERPGSNRRSGAGEHVATRRPSHRHILVDPA